MSITSRRKYNLTDFNKLGTYKLIDFYFNHHDYVSVQMHALEPGNPTKRRLSTAPHIVSMCKVVFIATIRYCVVTTEEMAEGANHEYIFREFMKLKKLRAIIERFVEMLAPTKKYTFWIYNPLDAYNEVSPLTVLVSIWKNLQGREPEIGDTERLESVLFAVLDEFNIQVDARKTVLTATLEGSKEHFHIRPKSGDGDKVTRVPSEWFFKKCSMSTVRTNVEMTPETTPFLPNDLQIAEFEHCFHSATDDLKIRESVAKMGKIMKKLSDARMEFRREHDENIEFNIDLDAAISKFETDNLPEDYINGHEIKTNGGLCLYYDKMFWGRSRTFVNNTIEIIRQAKEVVLFTLFERILPSAGAAFKPDWGSSEPTEKGVLKLAKKRPPGVNPIIITLDSDDEDNGEPSNKRQDRTTTKLTANPMIVWLEDKVSFSYFHAILSILHLLYFFLAFKKRF